MNSTLTPNIGSEDQSGTGFAHLETETDPDRDGEMLITRGSFEISGTSTDPTSTIDFSNGVVGGGGSNDAFYYYETLSVPAEVTLSWPCTFLSARLYIIQEFPSVGVFGTVIERLLNVHEDLQYGDEFYCGTESWIIPADTVFRVSFQANYSSNHPDDGEPHPSSGGGSFEIVVDPIILD